MWHKPCRTFHPWCLCIKTRCLFLNVETTRAVEIRPRTRQGPVYAKSSISLLPRTWAPSHYKDSLSHVWRFPQSWDRLIFNMGIHILVRRHFHIDSTHGWCYESWYQQWWHLSKLPRNIPGSTVEGLQQLWRRCLRRPRVCLFNMTSYIHIGLKLTKQKTYMHLF